MINILNKIFVISIITIAILVTGCGSETTSDTEKIIKITSDNNITIKENNSTDILKVTTDSDNDKTFNYTISGADKDAFSINNEGLLKFIEIPDYEVKNSYKIIIELKEDDELLASQNITITISDDLTDNIDTTVPEFSDLTEVKEIQENILKIMTIKATDDVSSVEYFIDNGDDKALFAIDKTSGELKFSNFIPDFEYPSDKDKNNDYEITISAIDKASNKATHNLTIRVTNDATDNINNNAVVLKTGVADGPNGPGYGDTRDTDTGLTWEDIDHVNTSINWEDAGNYCANKGMRLPTRKELFTLVNYGKFGGPMIDDSFNYKNTGIFWTKTNLLRYQYEIDTQAWGIDFRFGGDYPYDKNITEYLGYNMHVRCVSGAATFSNSSSFRDDGDVITDTTTGLIWENNETATMQKLTWNAAKTRCENKGSDWRLPNINELHTLMPENEMNLLLVGILGDNGNTKEPTWSSTDVPGAPNQALRLGNHEVPFSFDGVHFGDTQNSEQSMKDLNTSIRSICVRGGKL